MLITRNKLLRSEDLKKLILTTFTMLLVLLVLTKSLYVEYDELFLILVALMVFTTAYNFSRNRENNVKILLNTAISSYFLGWLLCIADIIIDHFTLPKGQEDGVPMTIGFTIDEFSDDMSLANLVCMFIVVITTFITTKTLSWIVSTRKY